MKAVQPTQRQGGETASAHFANFATDAFTLIDRFAGDVGSYTEVACLVQEEDHEKIDPSKYKDVYENPRKFKDAWDHPDPWQREKWRAAINKEFRKMEDKKVWRKIKRSEMEAGRRCVKHKWVFEIKRSGIFRARLVACGYSQIPGTDFTEVYAPVVNDIRVAPVRTGPLALREVTLGMHTCSAC